MTDQEARIMHCAVLADLMLKRRVNVRVNVDAVTSA